MRKKICNKCGKIIDDNVSCCVSLNKTISKRQEESDKELRTSRWRNTRLRVLKRDRFTCQRCLIKYGIINTEDLTVHHIKSRKEYPELFYDLNNLICLCRTCNLQLEAKEFNHKLDFKINISSDNEFIL